MNYSFLLFRCKQIGRYIEKTGAFYIVLPLLLLSGGLLQGLENLLHFSTLHLVLLYFFVVLTILSQRTDFNFLNHIEQSLTSIYLGDIGLISIPFCVLYLSIGKWPAALAVLVTGLLTAFLWPAVASYINARDAKSTSLKIDVPLMDLELKYLVRKYGVFLLILYIIALILSGYTASIFIFAFIFLACFQSTLEYFEPKEMIFYHDSAQHFLHIKIFRLWATIQLLLFPLYLIGLFMTLSHWYLFFLVFIASTIMIIFSICNKYVFYRPSVLQYKTNILAGLMLIFMLFPGFQLVVLFMSIIQYFKAKKNLNFYW